MKRITARELAVRLVFELDFSEKSSEELLLEALTKERFTLLSGVDELYLDFPDEKQKKYIYEVVNGVYSDRARLDGLIEKHIKGWKTDRLSKITRAILRIALFEIEHIDDAPEAAAINAAVELAKMYEDEDGAAFVNGILGAFSREEQKN